MIDSFRKRLGQWIYSTAPAPSVPMPTTPVSVNPARLAACTLTPAQLAEAAWVFGYGVDLEFMLIAPDAPPTPEDGFNRETWAYTAAGDLLMELEDRGWTAPEEWGDQDLWGLTREYVATALLYAAALP
jgi:hypothetical protein